MQVTIVFLLLVAVVSCEAAITKPSYTFPANKTEAILTTIVKCLDKKNDSKFIMGQIKQGKYLDDDRTVEVILCAYIDLGYQHEDGRYNLDKVMTELFPTKPEVRPMLEECDKNYHKPPVETLKTFFMCFREKLPFKIVV